MKVLQWILFSIGAIFILLLAITTAWAWLGLMLYIFGIYQIKQKQKGKITFSRPGWFLTVGILFAFIMSMVVTDPVQETTDVDKVKSNELENQEKDLSEKEKEEKEEQRLQAEKERVEKEDQLAKEKEAAEKQASLTELASRFGLEAVTVTRIIDGDTVELSDGRKVRLVGVNTPESTTRTETYGSEAKKYTASMIDGKKVWIQKDVSDTDRYGRQLRIIWLSVPIDDMEESEIRTKMLNSALVLNGYAEPSTYPPDVKYSDYFVKFAREAREKGIGLWAYGPEGTTKGDLDSTASKNSGHAGGAKTSPPTSGGGNEFYQNCTEMRKVYPNGVDSKHPAYASKHDRDKDGYACER